MEQINAIVAEISGFMKSRVILTACEFDLFSKLGNEPLTAHRLSELVGLDPVALARILDCLTASGYLIKSKDAYSNSEKGALLSSFHSETVLPVVNHFNGLWNTWGNLSDIAIGKKKNSKRSVIRMNKKSRDAFIGAMHSIGSGLSVEIAESYNLDRFRTLLDIGGASGTYTMAFLKKNPYMNAVLFDLKEVIPIARKRLQYYGFLKRVSLRAGDFYKDELPKGCDLALLSAIIHQNSHQENIDLYRKILRALLPGGALLIRDHIMDESRTSPPRGTLFAINMLVNTSGGNTYTFGEVDNALNEAGFVNVKLIRKGEKMDCLVEAEKPK